MGNSSAFPKIAEMDCFAEFFQTGDQAHNWDLFQAEWQDVNMGDEAIKELFMEHHRYQLGGSGVRQQQLEL